MENSSKSIHPLILVAAASVTIASLAAAAHFTGLLPTHSSEPPAVVANAPAAPAAAIPAPAAQPAPAAAQPIPAAPAEASRPAPKQHVQHHASEPVRQARNSSDDWRYDGSNRRVSTNDAGIDVIPSRPAPSQAATSAPPVCRECGTVESVREIATQGEGTGLGAVAGGVLGGVLGHQVGRGTGKDLATIAGAVGGAFAGNQVEKNVRTNKQYEVAVRFDDGTVRSYTLANTSWHTGDRVRLANGNLAPL